MSFFDGGLRFGCTGCGDCCRGPGTVYVGAHERERLASALGVDLETLTAAWLVPFRDAYRLVDATDRLERRSTHLRESPVDGTPLHLRESSSEVVGPKDPPESSEVGAPRATGEHVDESCVLLGADGRCTAYEARPQQCRAFPFWLENLRNPVRWRAAAARCPGIGQGELHDRSAILAALDESPI